jgi:hypothetical protein
MMKMEITRCNLCHEYRDIVDNNLGICKNCYNVLNYRFWLKKLRKYKYGE